VNVTISELMVEAVFTASPWHTVGEVKALMTKQRIHSVPVVDEEGTPLGIVTTSDLLTYKNPGTPISELMSTDIKTIPRYSGPHLAARVMRNSKIHHLLVTHEKKLVGILSTFDLLRLIEDHRFVAKNAPEDKKTRSRRVPAEKKE
jgi:CBS domain-containing protein